MLFQIRYDASAGVTASRVRTYAGSELLGTAIYSMEIVTEQLLEGKRISSVQLSMADDWALVFSRDHVPWAFEKFVSAEKATLCWSRKCLRWILLRKVFAIRSSISEAQKLRRSVWFLCSVEFWRSSRRCWAFNAPVTASVVPSLQMGNTLFVAAKRESFSFGTRPGRKIRKELDAFWIRFSLSNFLPGRQASGTTSSSTSSLGRTSHGCRLVRPPSLGRLLRHGRTCPSIACICGWRQQISERSERFAENSERSSERREHLGDVGNFSFNWFWLQKAGWGHLTCSK